MRRSGVSRRILAPLAWLVVLIPPAVVWTVTDDVAMSRPVVPTSREVRVEADVAASYDGGLEAPVRYLNPVTDQVVDLSVPVHRADLRPDAGGRTALLVDRDDPDMAMVLGDHEPVWGRLTQYAWLPLVPIAVSAARWVFARRVRRLVGRDAPAFSMLAQVTGSRVSAQRLVHLYPLDAPTGSRPLCTVAVLPWSHGGPQDRSFRVEVKGSPRPLGLVVVRAGEQVLWPTGPARTAARVTRPEPLGEPEDLSGDVADAGPPVAAVLDPASLALGCVAGLVLAVVVVGATLLGHHARAERLGTGTPVVVEAVGVLEPDNLLQVRWTDAEGRDQEATAAPQRAEAYVVGRRYPAVSIGTDGSRVELLAETYDRVEPILWGALVPAFAAALTLRQRVYTGPWSRAAPR